MTRLKCILLVGMLALSACQSPSFIRAAGGGPEDQLQNAEQQMIDGAAGGDEYLARRSVDEAFKIYKKRSDTVGFGHVYYGYGKIYRIFRNDFQKAEQAQLQAISYYKMTNFNPGLAVSYKELAKDQYFLGKKEQYCISITLSIDAFEKMKITHPGYHIPVYIEGFKDFGDFARATKQQYCGN